MAGAHSHGGGMANMMTGHANYTADGVMARGYMAYSSDHCSSTSKCPAVAIMPDWNGIDSYEMERAHMLAMEGWFAFVVDIYGVATVESWGDMPGSDNYRDAANAHRENAAMFMAKMTDGLMHMATYDVVDTNNMGAIGYCFGGTGVVNLALAGHSGMYSVPAGLKVVASFHAGTSGMITMQNSTSYPAIAIHNGWSDGGGIDATKMVELMDGFESKTVHYEVNNYGAEVPHGFTVFNGSRYHATADTRSWDATVKFMKGIFAGSFSPTSTATSSWNQMVSYMIGDKNFTGYMAYDTDKCSESMPCPAVAIIPDWTGMDTYEKTRADIIASMGYVAFAMDIYGDAITGSWPETPGFDQWSSASGMHLQDASLYMANIHGGISLMAGQSVVDSSKMAVIGYCFGGVGAINVALAGHGGTYNFPTGVLGAISYHAASNGIIPVETATSYPAMTIHNGYADGNGINAALMDSLSQTMEDKMMTFQTVQHGAGTGHGFTVFGGGAYDSRVDYMSWSNSAFMMQEILGMPPYMMPPTTMTTTVTGSNTTEPTSAATALGVAASAVLASFTAMLSL
eukprot:CAMPEP_0178430634 /NCGR_PEP_ID=MMETSP0689_2-20121128/31424_1 /TAXON_ID=160604 /ORGANISM="Amphidinium massartii, Strain CS-259" /LENGTH=569 /DNA_ID=CAMNT_0020052503 /DNA_START=115 /DNA_END=1824 /DNA_ORIENTATION=+